MIDYNFHRFQYILQIIRDVLPIPTFSWRDFRAKSWVWREDNRQVGHLCCMYEFRTKVQSILINDSVINDLYAWVKIKHEARDGRRRSTHPRSPVIPCFHMSTWRNAPRKISQMDIPEQIQYCRLVPVMARAPTLNFISSSFVILVPVEISGSLLGLSLVL